MRVASALLATVMIGGCGAAAATDPAVDGYPVGLAEAYQRLSTSKLDELRFRRQCGILIHINPYSPSNQSVTWVVTSSGREVLRFTANLQPVDAEHTRVSLGLPDGPDGKEAYSGDQFFPRPAFNQPLRPAIEEQIAAIMEGRDYDVRRVPPGRDGVCNVQRGGLETGRMHFSIDDEPGESSEGTASNRRLRSDLGGGWGQRSAGWGR